MSNANKDSAIAERLIDDDLRLMREEMKKPLIRLPCEDWLVSQFAVEVAAHVFHAQIYLRGGEVISLVDGELRPMTPRTFRTWVEQHLYTYRVRMQRALTIQVNTTMTEDVAAATLASPQFRERLLKLQRVNHTRLPVMRGDGRIELLPDGYDMPTRTLTQPGIEYQTDLAIADAVEIVNDLLSEFNFADGQRSKAVAVAMMLTLYAGQLIPEGALRPCFIVTKNAEGAGATTLVMIAVVPVLGMMPTGVKTDDDGETRKALTAAVREARQVILLDNQKARLSSAALEAFISSPQWSDRLLGENSTIAGPNLATVFATANGCTVSADMRRRSLFAELHLDVERAEDRQFRRPLDLPTLLALRTKVLAALWSMVRHWDSNGRPGPSRSHSAFSSWAQTVAGIVEAAGFGCCLETASVAVAADQDGQDMRALVNAMAGNAEPLSFSDLVTLAREQGCFESVIGNGDADELKPSARSLLGKMLGRYDRRTVGDHRFIIEGKGHKRRYRLETVAPIQQGQQGQQGLSVELGKRDISKLGGNTLSHLATMQQSQPVEEVGVELL